MPEEGRKFRLVDGYYKNIIAEAVRSPGRSVTVGLKYWISCPWLWHFVLFAQVKDTRVLVATDQDKMLEQLEESNVLLDDIQKGLNSYLEKKRLFFPRWDHKFSR